MIRRRYTAIFAVLASLTLFFGGMLTYRLVMGPAMAGKAATVTQGAGHREGITIEGRAVIEVIRHGQVVTTWKGHNALYAYGKNAIAACVSGATTAPALFGTCSGLITKITLRVQGGSCSGWCAGASATNTLTGCDAAGFCSGWTTEATVSMSQNQTVIGAAATDSYIHWFDMILNLNLPVNAGDSVDTTISFTVS